ILFVSLTSTDKRDIHSFPTRRSSDLKNDVKTGNRTKIIGGLFQVVDRGFYREELNQIIATQKQFHKSLEDKKVFEQCVNTLYPRSEEHTSELQSRENIVCRLLLEKKK